MATILIVDDQIENRYLLETLLKLIKVTGFRWSVHARLPQGHLQGQVGSGGQGTTLV